MRAVYFTGNRTLELREVADPTPGPDEVILEIRASGVCGTDLHAYRSPEASQNIKGHEPCGIVAAIGTAVDPKIARVGARAMVHHYDGCRTCRNCMTGWSQLCDEGSVVYGGSVGQPQRRGDGAHARWMKVPAHTLVALPEALSFDEGAAVSCGTGTAWGAIRRMKMEGGATLAVIGQGPVGLSATMLASAMGARVIAVDVSDDRLKSAKRFGADQTLNVTEGGLGEQLREMTGGLGVDYVMECSGNGAATEAALAATRSWGTLCLVGLGAQASFSTGPDIILRQISIVGSWTFSKLGQRECAEFCATRGLPVADLFTHKFDLEDAAEAYRLFDTQTTGKMVLRPQ
ncbi:MAG: zinc-binding dehydrogenase [Pseudomonadota bacterium]